MNAYDPRETQEARYLAQELMKIVGAFPKEEQELFRLKFILDLSYREMAALLEKSEGALRVAVSRLKRKIQSRFHHHA